MQIFVNNYDIGSILHQVVLQHLPYTLNQWPGPDFTIFLVDSGGEVRKTLPLDGSVTVEVLQQQINALV